MLPHHAWLQCTCQQQAAADMLLPEVEPAAAPDLQLGEAQAWHWVCTNTKHARLCQANIATQQMSQSYHNYHT